MIRALLTGTLHNAPQARTGASGKPYTTAKLKAVGKDGSTIWVSLVAFGDLAERLATINPGNAVAVSGRLEASAYLDKSGNPAAGLSVVVDELATLKARPKGRDEKPPQRRRAVRQPAMPGDGIPFDDPLPECFL